MAEADYLETEAVTFICRKCGECCRHIEPFIDILPHQHNGICDFLRDDLCSIYETRPDLCDYKRAYKYFDGYLSETEYREQVIYFCKKLKALRLFQNSSKR
jgi:Fe-S-cluster containining protein